MDSQPLPPSKETVVDVPVEPDPSKVKPSWFWIKDAQGYGSVTVTLLFVAFWITTLAYVASIFEHIGSVSIRAFDVGACAAYFVPILTLYFSRKLTDAKYKPNN